LVGGVAGVYLAGGVLSVASIIGFITLFGIATRNGIMLVSHIRHLRENEGVTDLREAVTGGALERLAPILMTALTAGLALIPIAAGMGKPGSELQAPMATVILFGLFTSTALNMVVVPGLAAVVHDTVGPRRKAARPECRHGSDRLGQPRRNGVEDQDRDRKGQVLEQDQVRAREESRGLKPCQSRGPRRRRRQQVADRRVDGQRSDTRPPGSEPGCKIGREEIGWRGQQYLTG